MHRYGFGSMDCPREFVTLKPFHILPDSCLSSAEKTAHPAHAR